MKSTLQQTLAPLVVKTQEDPFFLGWAITQYAHLYNMKKNAIAAWLHCDVNSLDKLFLCRLPDGTSQRVRTQIQQICDYIGCDSDRLIAIIREVFAVHQLKEASLYDNEGFLMAARDRHSDNDSDDKQDPK